MIADAKLLELMKSQWREADDDLRRRVPLWAEFLRSWRGLFSGQDEKPVGGQLASTALGDYPGGKYAGEINQFLSSSGYSVETLYAEEQPGIYPKLVFEAVETYISRINEAFFSQRETFALVPPRVWISPEEPDPGAVAERKAALEGASSHLQQDYRKRGNLDSHKRALRDAIIFGTGYTMQRESPEDEPYPRAVVERWAPWKVRPDPFGATADEWRYVILERRYPAQAAAELWPDCRDEILAAAAGETTGDETIKDRLTEPERSEVCVLEYIGWYDPQALESLAPGEDMQDKGRETLYHFHVLGGSDGPGETVLASHRSPYTHNKIPVQEYVILKSPSESSCHGIGLCDILWDDQMALIIFMNLLLEWLGLKTMPGGWVDALYANELEVPLSRGFRPNEWKFVNLGGKPIDQVLSPLKLDNLALADLMQIIELIRADASKASAVNPLNSGQTTKTYSDTATELNALQSESNMRFRTAVEEVDGRVRRSLELYCATSADAIKGWYLRGLDGARGDRIAAPKLWFWDDTSKDLPPGFRLLDPTVFDEPWEVVLLSGSTWVDNRRTSEDLLGFIKLAVESGQLKFAEVGLRRFARLRHIDLEISDLVGALQAPPGPMAPPQGALPPGQPDIGLPPGAGAPAPFPGGVPTTAGGEM